MARKRNGPRWDEAPRTYQVKSSISRQKATEILERLARDEGFRAEFEANPRQLLFEHHIDLSTETLPETVTLPPPEIIEEMLDLTKKLEKSAQPFGFALLFVVFGAMPMIEGAVPSGNGTG
jgi:hypothetical protein